MYGVRLYNGLIALKGQVHKIGDAEFIIKEIILEEEKDWSKGTFKTLSPVVVERPGFYEDNPKLIYAIPIEEDFKEVLLENIQRRFKAIKGYEPKIKVPRI